MSSEPWARRPAPRLDVGVTRVWHWALRAPGDLTDSRLSLRDDLLDDTAPVGAAEDDLERLLLTFEELTSNGLRHGRAPVEVTVSTTKSGWLVDVTDAATTGTPTPAVDRDPAYGGLGLHLVARLSTMQGWEVRLGRKHVWACIARTAAA